MPDSLLGNDLVINEDSCNLSCQYCLTGQSNLKDQHRLQLIFQPPQRDTYAPGTELADRIDRVADRLKDRFRLPLLKVTGGEIFLVRGILDFLAEQAPKYEVLVVQTNAVLVRDEHLERFRDWGNVVLQLSLDSHLPYGNSYRTVNDGQHRKLVDAVDRIMRSGIPTEIYTVLNDRSVTELEPFAEWLSGFDPAPVFFPFPVRGPDAEDFRVRPEQIGLIERFAKRYEDFRDVLPPAAYLNRLLSFYREGKRTFRCHLPRLVVSSFSDGVVTPCPNIWFTDMGNVLTGATRGRPAPEPVADRDQAGAAVLEKVGETPLYQALLAPRPRLKACHGCFTPWDTLSMYFDDEITLDELCAAPTYSPAAIREQLRRAKAEYVATRDAEGVRS
jgi:MoaA/NifB/PqqE/SkfB family radical SAM enzyme